KKTDVVAPPVVIDRYKHRQPKSLKKSERRCECIRRKIKSPRFVEVRDTGHYYPENCHQNADPQVSREPSDNRYFPVKQEYRNDHRTHSHKRRGGERYAGVEGPDQRQLDLKVPRKVTRVQPGPDERRVL